ncbi:tetratricopeptide repeat protein, partial [Candidatus Woesearchaeota archaeon]|nr:tetratricopeptide repeat protein [Candidatus Woesearchaeota archaeon]
MSGRIARKRRKQAVKRAAIAAGMTVATAGALAAWDWVIGPEHNFRTVYLLTASTAPAAFTYYSWEMKRYLRRPFLDIPIVAVYAGIQTANWVLLPVSDKEKTYARMRTWLKKSERVYQPHQYMIAHAEIDLHQGRFESALAKYEAALKETPEGLLGRNVFSMVAYGAAEMFSRVVTPHEKRYRQEIESAFSWYAAGHFSRALMHWKRVMEEKKDDIEVNILYAKALSAMGMYKEAQEQWADTARMVRERVDEDKFIRVEKIEGFDVYKVTPSLLLEGNFDFKISDSQDSILLEKIQTEKTNETLEDWITANSYEDRFGVMQTIGAASNGMHSLITRHEPGDTLFEYTSCSKDT